MPSKDFKFWLQYLPSNLEDIFGALLFEFVSEVYGADGS